jgi:hypothetical protein
MKFSLDFSCGYCSETTSSEVAESWWASGISGPGILKYLFGHGQLSDLGAGFGDALEHGELLLRESLHCGHEVRDQIQAPLILRLHLTPCRTDTFILRDKIVVNAEAPGEESEGHDGDHDEYRGGNEATTRLHWCSLVCEYG